MFNKKDASAEIATSMEKVLVAGAIDKQTEGLSKVSLAIQHLNAAAEIFDTVGLRKHAEVATVLLESLASKKKKKPKAKSKSKSKPKSKPKPSKSPKSDDATKDLTSEKMLDNLAHKGWVFNADDDMNNSSDYMDSDDDNYAKLDISGGPGNYNSSVYWEHMAKKYMREGDLRKAEQAKMKAMHEKEIEKYDESFDADDFNFGFDMGFADESGDEFDFEDEVEEPTVRRRHTMLPPSMDRDAEMPHLVPYRPSSGEWHAVEETSKKTMPAKPGAKKHWKELEDEFDAWDWDY
jgi:hypothetical protein